MLYFVNFVSTSSKEVGSFYPKRKNSPEVGVQDDNEHQSELSKYFDNGESAS